MTSVVQPIAAEEVVRLVTVTPEIAGARLFTNIVAGDDATVLPYSSSPMA